MKLRDRIVRLLLLRAVALPESAIADELFVDRKTADETLRGLMREGVLYRKFQHNRVRGRPDYLYSLVPFPSRYPLNKSDSERGGVVHQLTGDWDSL